MNWSAYSRFVGDVFGAPLAMEGLAAFFLESTFLGLWLFGWGRLSPARAPGHHLDGGGRRDALRGVHHGGQLVDAAPGGLPARTTATGRSSSNIWAVLTNPVFLWGYAHVLLASLVTGCAWSCWPSRPGTCGAARTPTLFARSARLALVVLLPAACLGMSVGSQLGVIEDEVPADEDRGRPRRSGRPASPARSRSSRSAAATATRRRRRSSRSRTCCRCSRRTPGTARCRGSTSSTRSTSSSTGPGDYVPNVFVQYWSMRVMAYPRRWCSSSRSGGAGGSGAAR